MNCLLSICSQILIVKKIVAGFVWMSRYIDRRFLESFVRKLRGLQGKGRWKWRMRGKTSESNWNVKVTDEDRSRRINIIIDSEVQTTHNESET